MRITNERDKKQADSWFLLLVALNFLYRQYPWYPKHWTKNLDIKRKICFTTVISKVGASLFEKKQLIASYSWQNNN